jgi:hypothetical protein
MNEVCGLLRIVSNPAVKCDLYFFGIYNIVAKKIGVSINAMASSYL